MSRAHARPHRAKRRILLVGLVSAGALSALAVAALATGAGQEEAAGQQIVCPSPVAAIPAVPAAAQAEVSRELANLDKQLAEANARLVSSAGEGGANFVQNAILGPLASKRTAALDRIETAIGRVAAKPQGLEQFATCQLGEAGQAPPATSPAPGTESPAAQEIVCPSPVDAIPEVPAAAQAEVSRELANLDKQLAEANARLVSSVGQGGPNFVQNAILGPLASKRTAALDRIEIAIGRVAAKPEGLEQFATCQLGAAPPSAEPTQPATSAPATSAPATSAPGTESPAAQEIVCPSPVDAIPAVPAAAQAEVSRELANLDKQLAEANARLVSSAGEGGANFVQNAILGPLASKRTAALDRIETAIGRVAAKPQGLEQFATCQLG
jgi:regulator of protease activity HflC (stomatin/prohibitin superfamily)